MSVNLCIQKCYLGKDRTEALRLNWDIFTLSPQEPKSCISTNSQTPPLDRLLQPSIYLQQLFTSFGNSYHTQEIHSTV